MVQQQNKKNSTDLKRLNFKTYLKAINNSVGSNIFRNYYVSSAKNGEFDALNDGDNSCAFYVSAMLRIFGKISSPHGTIQRTLEDMQQSGWKEVDKPRPGDVVLWEPKELADGVHQHMGFYMGNHKAISNSSGKRSPQGHDLNFGHEKRAVEKIFRMASWDG